ncbi:MAG: hypothetical protein OHK006_09500 [Thermodesulfovibrionales bacterium]
MGRRVLTYCSTGLVVALLLFCGCDSPQEKSSLKQDNAAVKAPGNTGAVQAAGDAKNGSTALLKAPRIIYVRVNPPMPRRGEQLSVVARTDEDGADGVGIRYDWSINGVAAETSDPTLSAPLKKGDKVTVVLTPYKGGQFGIPMTQVVTIGNSPPLVKTNLDDVVATLERFSARVVAEDPDGDPVSFVLLQGPEGMQIDMKNGRISWVYRQRTSGVYTLSISVKDVDGAETILNLPISVEFQARPKTMP